MNSIARIAAEFAALLPLLVITLWSHLYQFADPLQWDPQGYVVMGRWLAHGLIPYRDMWDIKPPGVMFYFAAVFSVLPEALWSIRLVDTALFCAGAVLLYSLCRRAAIPPLAAIATGIWAVLEHHPAIDWGGMFAEEYVSLCWIGAMLAAASAGAFWAGFAVSVATLFKHAGCTVALPVVFLLWTSKRRFRDWLPPFMGGLAAPILATAGFFAWHHALGDFWQTILTTRLYVTHVDPLVRVGDVIAALRELAGNYPVIGVMLLIGSLGLLRPTRLALGSFLWAVSSLVAFGTYSGTNYLQDWLYLFAPFAAFSAIGLGTIFRTVRFQLAALAIIAVVGARPTLDFIQARQPAIGQQWNILLSGPSAWRADLGSNQVEAEIGQYLREHTRPDEPILVACYGPSMCSIYWLADRMPATRYFYEYAASVLGEERVTKELEQTRPPYIVVRSGFLRDWLPSHYVIEREVWCGYQIWRHKDKAADLPPTEPARN